MQYPAETFLQPRSFVVASNEHALVLQSLGSEVQLVLINSNAAALPTFDNRFVVSASNSALAFSKGSQQILSLDVVSGTPSATLHGGVLSVDTVRVNPTAPPARKTLVMYDANPLSSHQFAGFGYSNGRVIHQAPSWLGTLHGFYAAADSESSYEIARLQRSTTGICQLGIGITSNIDSNVALHVEGPAVIQGDLCLNGNLQWPFLSNLGFVVVDPTTQRIGSNALPTRVPLLDPTTNTLPTSILPASNQFQFLRANKNVGIGTRAPLQKLHVQGGTYISDRIGIGTTVPLARVHALEADAPIATCIVQANAGGDPLLVTVGSQPALSVLGSHPSVGICTSVVASSNALEVNGNAAVSGTVTASNIVMSRLLVKDAGAVYLSQDTVTLSDNTRSSLLNAYIPIVTNQYISTPTITSASNASNVRFVNCGLSVDGPTVFAQQPLVISDKECKTGLEVMTGCLDRIMQIRGYTYTTCGVNQAGVLAHEVESVLPEAVQSCDAGVQAVSYTSLVPMLIEAVRDLAGQANDRIALYSTATSNLVRMASSYDKAYIRAGNVAFGQNSLNFEIASVGSDGSISNSAIFGPAYSVVYGPASVSNTLSVTGRTTLADVSAQSISLSGPLAITTGAFTNLVPAPQPAFSVCNASANPVLAAYGTGQVVVKERLGVGRMPASNVRLHAGGDVLADGSITASNSIACPSIESTLNPNVRIALTSSGIVMQGSVTLPTVSFSNVDVDAATISNLAWMGSAAIACSDGSSVALLVSQSNACNIIQCDGPTQQGVLVVTSDGRVGIGSALPPSNTLLCTPGCVIDVVGNVGIGTLGPTAPLSIYRTDSNTSVPSLSVQHTTCNAPYFVCTDSNSLAVATLQSNGSLALGGPWDPTWMLNVSGDARLTTVSTSYIVPAPGDCNVTFGNYGLSNVSSIACDTFSVSNATISNAVVTSLHACNLEFPGVYVDASGGSVFGVQLSNLWFMGNSAYFGASLSNQPTNPKSDGKLKIDVPAGADAKSTGLHLMGQGNGDVCARVTASNARARYDLLCVTNTNQGDTPIIGVMGIDAINTVFVGHENVGGAGVINRKLEVAIDKVTMAGGKVNVQVNNGFVGMQLESSAVPTAALEINGALYVRRQNLLGGISPVLFTDNATGNVGIGTKAAYAPLHVQGGAYVTGNVGIGTATALSKLHVQGDLNFTGQLLSNSSPFASSQWASGSSSNISYRGGNVGIGTTNPTRTLEVVGDLNVSGQLLNNNSPITTSLAAGSVYFSNLDSSAYNFQWMKVATGGLRTKQRVVIDSDLIVGGNIYSASNLNLDSLYPGGSVYFDSQAQVYTCNIVNGAITIPKIDFSGTGNVGIGTSTALSKLHVQGDLNFTGRLLSNSAPYVSSQWTTSGSSNIFFSGGNVGIGTTQALQALHTIGNIYATGDITAFSDGRYKTNLEPIPDPLVRISQITGYTFDRIDANEPRRHVGVIAQDVQKVLPEAVHWEVQSGTASVAYGNMVALLIEGIKALERRVTSLESR